MSVCHPEVDAGRAGAAGSVVQSLLLLPQQLHSAAGSVDLRLLRAHPAGPGSALLFSHELRHLQGLPDPVGHPRTVDETGPPAVGEPRSSPSAGTTSPAATASPWCPATSTPGCAHAAGRHTQPTPDGLPKLICLVSVRNNSCGGLDVITATAFGSWVTRLFAVLTVCQGGLEATCGGSRVRQVVAGVSEMKGKVGRLFVFLRFGQKKGKPIRDQRENFQQEINPVSP